MHLVEARKNNLKFHNINNRDLFNLFGILLNEKGCINEIKEKAIDYAKKNKVEKSVIMTLTGAANCKIGYNLNSKKRETNMWTVFEETWKEGKMEGKMEGKAEEIVEIGYEFGLSENDILERLQTKMNISLQKAQEYLAMFGKRVV